MSALIGLFLILPMIYIVAAMYVDDKKIQLRPIARKLYLMASIFFTVLFLISHYIPEKRNLHFRGYRSASFIFLSMWFLWAVFDIFNWKSRRKYFIFNFLGLAICIGLGLSSILIFDLVDSYRRNLVYNDSRHRVEYTGHGIMDHCRLPELFVKSGILEKNYLLDKEGNICLTKAYIKKVTINETTPDSLLVIFYHENTRDEIPNPVTINIKL
jgi:hypothetical protein